jgi:RNA polymerase subunit RPABC4/transcription elongation factor Spt4
MKRVAKYRMCDNCDNTILYSEENLCQDCMVKLYSEPLNTAKLRPCRKCSKLSTNYFYCHEHKPAHGEHNDFLDYALVINTETSNRRYE